MTEKDNCQVATEKRGTPSYQSFWSVICLIVYAAIYVVILCAALPSYVDEAYTFNLARDKSIAHMLTALRHGADGSFPLYAVGVFLWEKLFGGSEFALRLSSGLLVVCFVWHSATRLLPHFGPAVSLVTVSFVLADAAFTFYALQVRCYGLLVFLFSLCFWSTWDLLRNESNSFKQVYHGIFCGLLCLSHPLGLVYSGVLASLYIALSLCLKRFSLGNACAFIGGPALFLLWLPSFLDQRIVNPTYHAGEPGWVKYWKFAFFGNPWLFVILVLGCMIFAAVRWTLASQTKASEAEELSKSAQSESCEPNNRLLIIYSVGFVACFNAVAFLLDALHIVPLYWNMAIRYGLVCWVAYAVIVASILACVGRLLRPVPGGYGFCLSGSVQFTFGLLGVLLLSSVNAYEVFTVRVENEAFLTRVSNMGRQKQLPVVCQLHIDAFYLASHAPNEHVQYVLADDFEYKRLMLQMAKYYPNPVPISAERLSQCTNEYLFVSYWPRDAWVVGQR